MPARKLGPNPPPARPAVMSRAMRRSYTENSPGLYTAQLRALADARVVAVSPDSAPFDVTDRGLADLGVVTISPCGTSCP